MSAPSWVVNQAQRLRALAESGILENADEAFDRIVLRATQICKTPVSIVTLVADDRQWFKARLGFDLSETPLSQSICKYALDHTGVLVIADLTLDPRTSENDFVTGESGIRFYAGARIKAPDGTPIGSLCVIDTAPRLGGLSEYQSAALEGLAFECSTLIASQAKQAP